MAITNDIVRINERIFMKKLLLSAVMAIVIITGPVNAYQSLQEVFNQAGGSGDYDKYLELNPAIEYLGDLNMPNGLNACIQGNGAIIFGVANNTAIRVGISNLDISNCIIVGGHLGIFFDTLASGIINSNTITGCDSAGVTVLYNTSQVVIEVWDNIITDCFIGFLCVEYMQPDYLGHNTVYNAGFYRYAEFCPS